MAKYAVVFFGVAIDVLLLEVHVFLQQMVSIGTRYKVWIQSRMYLLLSSVERLPLLRNQLHPIPDGNVLEVAAGLAID